MLLTAALVAAAVVDLRTRTIPNGLTAAIALLAIPFWWATGLDFWPDIAIRIAVAAGVFAFFAGAFAIGMMGGGDVKLVAAISLWLNPAAVVVLLVLTSLAGGALTVVMLLWHWRARSKRNIEIPYGVAIAFGGLWLISERILNQFG